MRDKGFTLVETMMALLILLVVTAGVLPLTLVATKTAENQGHLTSRTSQYAADKLEQLMGLTYADAASDTRVFPTAAAGGSGLAAGGSSDPDAPVNLYVDYLDADGSLMAANNNAAPAGWYYRRVWRVDVTATNLKQITVTSIVRSSSGGGVGMAPRTTVMALKSSPF
jgi:prepilin-type N-terminal cleavage/methylation domain-containing protein